MRGTDTCAVCDVPMDPNGSTPEFTATSCEHKVCSACWESLQPNTMGTAPEEEMPAMEFCGGRTCVLAAPEHKGGVCESQGSTSEEAKRGAYWRHHVEGVRLLEACIHEDVREAFMQRLRVNSAAQLDSGMRDLQLAYHQVAKIFNNTEWHPESRFEQPPTPQRTRARINPHTTACVVSHSDVQEKLNDIRKIKTKAKSNMNKSGSHAVPTDIEISQFCRDKPPNGNIWWDVWYFFKLEKIEEFSSVLSTITDEMPALAQRESTVGGVRGQSASARRKRQREEYNKKLSEQMDDELKSCGPEPDDSVSNIGSSSTLTASAIFSPVVSRVETTELQRQQSLLTKTIMDLMAQLSNPHLLPQFRSFLAQQLEYNQKKLEGTQNSGTTPTKQVNPNPPQAP